MEILHHNFVEAQVSALPEDGDVSRPTRYTALRHRD